MPAPKKNAVGRIIKKVAQKATKGSAGKVAKKTTAKKGYKVVMKPNLDSLPTSNVKVKGKSRATTKQIADAGLMSRTVQAPRVPVKGKRGTAKTWGRKDSLN